MSKILDTYKTLRTLEVLKSNTFYNFYSGQIYYRFIMMFLLSKLTNEDTYTVAFA